MFKMKNFQNNNFEDESYILEPKEKSEYSG